MYKFAYVYALWGQSFYEVTLEFFCPCDFKQYFLVFQLIKPKSYENSLSNQVGRKSKDLKVRLQKVFGKIVCMCYGHVMLMQTCR